jgi:hypothetical protein
MEADPAHKTAIKDEPFSRKKPSVQCDSQVSTIRWHIRAELSLPD